MINWEVYINDILNSVNRILEYIRDQSFDVFVSDYKTYDAVLRNLEIIGEAVKKIPEEVKKDYDDIEWRKITNKILKNSPRFV